jgi:hypothetical protein
MNAAPEKQLAHELIERLPDVHIATAVRILEFMLLDPLARAVATAPPDDEPVRSKTASVFTTARLGFGNTAARALRVARWGQDGCPRPGSPWRSDCSGGIARRKHRQFGAGAPPPAVE